MSAKKNKSPRQAQSIEAEKDSTFFLKLVFYVILGAVWLRFQPSADFGVVAISFPIGLCIGLLFAAHDHFQIDRKIEYTVLVLATVFSYFLPTGIVL